MYFPSFHTNLDLHVALCARAHKDLRDYNYLFSVLKDNSCVQLCESSETSLKDWCRRFCYRVYAKWTQSGRSTDKFRKKHGIWLQAAIQWPEFLNENIESSTENVSDVIEPIISPTKSDASTCTHPSPRKSFEDLSNRQKRRRTEDTLACSSSSAEIVFSAERALRKAGESDTADVMKYLMENPEEASKIKAFIEGKSIQVREISPLKALALYVSMNLSKWRYNTLRDFNTSEGALKYPSYYMLVKEKIKCYPAKEDLTVTESSAKIKLQALMDLTSKRLIRSLETPVDPNQQLVLTSKWGFDGSSSQSIYHQRTSEDEQIDLASNFMISLVPLRLVSKGVTIWENERPSSTSFCRPILFKFIKETKENVQREMAEIEAEIEALTPSTITDGISVKHQLLLTMIDGKIHSIISDTAASVCDICKASPKEMNNLELVKDKHANEDMYKYSLSILHAWIRSMECLLHISYKLDIKSWQAKGDIAKRQVDDRKKRVQEAVRRETGLLLDVVKQGSGSTNNGNSARRFFENYAKSAELTGIDAMLLRKICVILQCISSGEKINVSKFREFCFDTAKLYVELYPWYYMPSSLHKILMHGPDIVQNLSIMPIGFLSEEASEARNKDFRKYREGHSRKHSSISCNEDIMHNLLLSSDPLVTSIRPKVNKFVKKSSFKEFYELTDSEKSDIEFVNVSDLADIDSEFELIDDDDDDDDN